MVTIKLKEAVPILKIFIGCVAEDRQLALTQIYNLIESLLSGEKKNNNNTITDLLHTIKDYRLDDAGFDVSISYEYENKNINVELSKLLLGIEALLQSSENVIAFADLQVVLTQQDIVEDKTGLSNSASRKISLSTVTTYLKDKSRALSPRRSNAVGRRTSNEPLEDMIKQYPDDELKKKLQALSVETKKSLLKSYLEGSCGVAGGVAGLMRIMSCVGIPSTAELLNGIIVSPYSGSSGADIVAAYFSITLMDVTLLANNGQTLRSQALALQHQVKPVRSPVEVDADGIEEEEQAKKIRVSLRSLFNELNIARQLDVIHSILQIQNKLYDKKDIIGFFFWGNTANNKKLIIKNLLESVEGSSNDIKSYKMIDLVINLLRDDTPIPRLGMIDVFNEISADKIATIINKMTWLTAQEQEKAQPFNADNESSKKHNEFKQNLPMVCDILCAVETDKAVAVLSVLSVNDQAKRNDLIRHLILRCINQQRGVDFEKLQQVTAVLVELENANVDFSEKQLKSFEQVRNSYGFLEEELRESYKWTVDNLFMIFQMAPVDHTRRYSFSNR